MDIVLLRYQDASHMILPFLIESKMSICRKIASVVVIFQNEIVSSPHYNSTETSSWRVRIRGARGLFFPDLRRSTLIPRIAQWIKFDGWSGIKVVHMLKIVQMAPTSTEKIAPKFPVSYFGSCYFLTTCGSAEDSSWITSEGRCSKTMNWSWNINFKDDSVPCLKKWRTYLLLNRFLLVFQIFCLRLRKA